MWGSLLFHLGIIPVFFGHVVGLLIPKPWMDAVGVSAITSYRRCLYWYRTPLV